MFSSLRARLVLLLLVAALPSFALVVFIAVEQHTQERQAAGKEAIRYAESVGTEVDRSIGTIQELLDAMSQSPAIQGLNPDACTEVLVRVTTTLPAYKDTSFFVADTGGDIFCSNEPLDPSQPLVNISDRGYFQHVLATGAFAVGEYQVGRVTGLANIAQAQPVFRGTELVAVVLASVPLAVLSERVGDVALPEDSAYSLLDRNGTILATNVAPADWIGQEVSHSELAWALGKGAGAAKLSGFDDRLRLYGFTPVGDPEATGLTLAVGIPISVAYGAIDRDMYRNLALLAVVAVLGMCAAWIGSDLFVGKQTRRLISDVRQYAVGESTWHAPRERGGVSELTELHNAFDSLASVVDLRDAQRGDAALELKEANAQLERRVAGRTRDLNDRNHRLEYEIDQRKAAEAEMQRYAADLSRANTDLEEFTYAVSHDLKAPLRGISGFASMVIEDNAEGLDETARENLAIIMQSAEQMRQLIDDLLALSRIARTENGHADISTLQEVREVESEMAYTLKEKGIVLKVADDLPVIHSGPVRLKQILRNLIGNAVKYDDKSDPTIEVGWLQDKPGSYTFFVRDNGKGIDPRFHERIFRVFQRLDPRQESEGTGIGLTICKKAVESLGGTIWVESEPGKGSTFYFNLPITNADAQPEESPDSVGGRQSA